ncbi:MAG: S9 family peptidase, partial [Pseudomonadota bacterium]
MNKWVVVLGLVLMPVLAWADNHGDDRRLSVEKLWQMDRVGSPVVSPAGGHVVVPVTHWDVENDSAKTRLWLLSTDGGVQRALTSAGQSASSPTFSPDGSTLAFVSTRGDDEAGQIYLLSMDGPGEATRLTEVPTSVSSLKWVGEHLYFISSIWPDQSWEEMTEQIQADRDTHVSAMQWNALPYSSWDRYLDEDRQAHLYRVPAAGGDVQPLTTEWDV